MKCKLKSFEIENMLPWEYYIYTKNYIEISNNNKKDSYDLNIINAYMTRVFSTMEKININKYLINKFSDKEQTSSSSNKTMTQDEIFGAVKKMHISLGGRAKDFSVIDLEKVKEDARKAKELKNKK